MTRFFMAVMLGLCLTAGAVQAATYSADIQVFFSPQGGAAAEVIRQIGEAKTQVRVQAYSFTHTGIAKALVDAKKRGVDVEVVLDRSNRAGKYSAADFTAHGGIPTFIDAQHPSRTTRS